MRRHPFEGGGVLIFLAQLLPKHSFRAVFMVVFMSIDIA